MSIHQSAVCGVLCALLPLGARAQTVRGAIVDPNGSPVPGVVLLLVDAASRVAARALSSERGDFRLSAPSAGSYRIRAIRIGFRPVMSDPINLQLGDEVSKRLMLSALPVALDTVHAIDRNVCRAFTDSGAATYAVWEQIRTALTAAELTAASRTIAATTVAYERALDPGPGRTGGHVLRQQASVATAYVTQAWRTPGPDSLRRVGYVVTERDNSTVYYAPGLDMLLSNYFVEDHCFRLTNDRNRNALVGLVFEPTPQRKKGAPEIRGTLWVDRASSELRRLDFRYVNLSREQEEQAGGELEFARMRDGAWAISKWNIRMPLIVEQVQPGPGTEIRVSELRVGGGELVLARRGSDTLWTGSRAVLSGLVLDSISGAPLSGARVALLGTALEATSDPRGRFTIPGVLPGQYTVQVRTSSLDSINAVHSSVISFADATTPIEARVARATNHVASRDATFVGVVVADSTREPITGAEVAISDLAKTTFTDSHGAFVLNGIPAGEHAIVVRHIGYGAAEMPIIFNARDSVQRRIGLKRAVTLEPVRVSETAYERAMASFDENRRVGLGHFMTRAELAKHDGMKLSGVLQQLPGLELMNGLGGNGWVTSRRAPSPGCPAGPIGTGDFPTAVGKCMQNHGYYLPDRSEIQQGMKAACYSHVYIDGVLMNGPKEPTEPFDVNTIAPEQVEAIEFYSGASQTPLQYSRMGSNCGVLVIWRRRSP